MRIACRRVTHRHVVGLKAGRSEGHFFFFSVFSVLAALAALARGTHPASTADDWPRGFTARPMRIACRRVTHRHVVGLNAGRSGGHFSPVLAAAPARGGMVVKHAQIFYARAGCVWVCGGGGCNATMFHVRRVPPASLAALAGDLTVASSLCFSRSNSHMSWVWGPMGAPPRRAIGVVDGAPPRRAIGVVDELGRYGRR